MRVQKVSYTEWSMRISFYNITNNCTVLMPLPPIRCQALGRQVVHVPMRLSVCESVFFTFVSPEEIEIFQ